MDRIKKYFGLFLAAAIFIGSLIGPLSVQAASGSKIILNYKSVTMRAGDTLDLNVASSAGVKSSKKVTWKSSNKKVASVDKNGVVKAKKTGTVTITATVKNNKEKASCKIKVQKKQASKTKALVAYFSCTGTTKGIAEKVADVTGGDLYRITPAKKYTSKDLNYDNEKSRTSKEQNNKKMRPQLKGNAVSMKNYDVIFLGYPIWWEDAPRILSTFVESYDFKGKTVVPFCTSASSGIGKSAKRLAALSKGTWLKGRRFSGNASQETVSDWVQGLGVLEGADGNGGGSTMNLKIGKKVFTAKLADNASAKELAAKLAKKPITISMQDYGGFEKVGDFGFTLAANDKQMTTEPGDLVLYEGDQLVIFYGKNSWSYTRLGKIQDVTAKTLKAALGSGDVTVTLSLP
ncbi:MAG: flavodoxin [Roseburia sp.]|nr:flavodoxin [Roseburia sp.]